MLYKIFSNILHVHNIIDKHLGTCIKMLHVQYVIYIGTYLQIMFIRRIIRQHFRIRRSCFVLYLIIKSSTYMISIYTIIQNILFWCLHFNSFKPSLF